MHRWTELCFAGLALVTSVPTLAAQATLHVPGDHATVQAAIDAAAEGDEIHVAPGLWVGSIDLDGKGVRLLGLGGAAETTIQGTGGSVVSLISGEGPGTIVEGFTITGAEGLLDSGALVSGSSPVIRDCIFTGNVNYSLGGGLHATQNAEPLVERCMFLYNSSERGGGLAGSQGAIPVVVDCVITANIANGVIGEGGGFYFGSNSDGVLVNCLVYDNVAKIGGAAKVRAGADAVMINCTMVLNRAHLGTGGFFNSNAFPRLENSILWANIGGDYEGYANTLHDQDGGITSVAYSIVEEGFAGPGVLDVDPGLVDVLNGDLRLALGSPAIDAGDNASVPRTVSTDVAGLARLADEPLVADTGNGAAPIVDIGAHEHAPACSPEGGPYAFCNAKLNSQGCAAAIAWSGQPAIGPSAGAFEISASGVLNFTNGIFFYGVQGRAQIPFYGGTLCVAPPLRRTSIQNSGGTPPPTKDCSGVYAFAFGDLLLAGSDPLLVPGQQVDGQYWYRDTQHFDGTGASLSNAIEFAICAAP